MDLTAPHKVVLPTQLSPLLDEYNKEEDTHLELDDTKALAQFEMLKEIATSNTNTESNARVRSNSLPTNPSTSKASPTQAKAKNPKQTKAKTHVCPVPSCGKVYGDRSGLRKHKKAKHSFKCPHNCGDVFTSIENMFAHMHSHS
jgi:hypothetical protein